MIEDYRDLEPITENDNNFIPVVWLGFLNVRCDHHSQKELIEIATLIGEELEKIMPNIFSQLNWRKGMFL